MTNALGIDVGKSGFHLAIANPAIKPHKWEVFTFTYTDLNWRRNLAEVSADSIVTLEPTGWHYSAPIINVLLSSGAMIYRTSHKVTRFIREAYIAANKTDAMDARALAYISLQLKVDPTSVRSTYRYDTDLEVALQDLRNALNAHRRVTKQSTRLTNQLHQFAHSIDPLLSRKLDTYMKAVEYDAITPSELKEFALIMDTDFKNIHGTARKHIRIIADNLPTIEVPTSTARAIQSAAQELREAAQAEEAILAEISAILNTDAFEETTRRLLTIPRAGLVQVATVITACHGSLQLLDRDELRAALGCRPSLQQSGDKSEGQAVRNNKPAKTAIRLWTMGLINHGDNPIAHYFHSTQSKRAMNAAMGKLVKIIHAVANDPRGYLERTPS
jgi:hypothetical protein